MEITQIPLDCLTYRWSAPHYSNEKRNKVIGQLEKWSKMLMSENAINTMQGKNHRIRCLYNDILDNGLVNPLIVKPYSYDKLPSHLYYTVIGNQRLAILRALEYKNWLHLVLDSNCFYDNNWHIPSLIAAAEDNWEDDTPALIYYKSIQINYVIT